MRNALTLTSCLFVLRVQTHSWLLLMVLWPSWACFPSSTPHPCCPSLERTTFDFRNSSREAPRKRPLLRDPSPPHISAPAFHLWMKRALTLSAVTTPLLPKLQTHHSGSPAPSDRHGSPSDHCTSTWHRLTHSGPLMTVQSGSPLRWGRWRGAQRTLAEILQTRDHSWTHPEYLHQSRLGQHPKVLR